MISKTGFAAIPIPERPDKPRQNGLTMVIDPGMGLTAQRELIDCWGDYIDICKIPVGYSRLLPESYLKEKIDIYVNSGIDTFPGGQFLELAIKQGNVEYFLDEAKRLGFGCIEISDNLEKIPNDKKHELLQKAIQDYGFKVFGEIGSKVGHTDPELLIEDINSLIEAGAWKVYIEALELFGKGLNRELLDRLRTSVPAEKMIFEVPLVYFPEFHHFDVMKIYSWLIINFGVNTNIANVDPGEIGMLECIRRGILADASNPAGAYQMAGFVHESSKILP